ncbi:MAG: glutamate--tRNA ligase [Chloroflexi bacterium]|nr:glutamate--tRNA ligase [Chloroflexota bacterium]
MSTVRVRYAPSPTGAPHVGNIRTALFTWLYARHHGGRFIVRIEDTDQAREVENGLQLIMESLRWLGLDWDEGPDIGGPFGPYKQSERLHRYQRWAAWLVERGHAYRCYCSPERLEQMRKEQEARKLPLGYDRRCRFLSEAERAQKAAEGIVPVIRLAVPLEGQTTYYDLLHGDVTVDNKTIDDQVLLKSDGFPTYHLGVVVDDHEMQITHVTRGDDWISSGPKHALLYRFFGWEMPVLAQLPMILGADRKKLSKRHGSTSVVEFRDQGYLPEAMLNFLARLGWSYDDKTEIFSRAELISLFDLDKVHPSAAIFDVEKLNWLNGHYIRTLDTLDLARRIRPFLDAAGIEVDNDLLLRVVPLVQTRIKTLKDPVELAGFFFVDDVHPTRDAMLGKAFAAQPNAARAALEAVRAAVAVVSPFEAAVLETDLRALAERLQIKPGNLFTLIREAVTARTVTPPLFDTLAVLGQARTLARLDAAIRIAG